MPKYEEYKQAKSHSNEQQFYDTEENLGLNTSVNQPVYKYDARQFMDHLEDRFSQDTDFQVRTEYYFKDAQEGMAKATRYESLHQDQDEEVKQFAKTYGNHGARKRKRSAGKAKNHFDEMSAKMMKYSNDDQAIPPLDSYTKYLHKEEIMKLRLKGMISAAEVKSKSKQHEAHLKERAKLSCNMALKDQLTHIIAAEQDRKIKGKLMSKLSTIQKAIDSAYDNLRKNTPISRDAVQAQLSEAPMQHRDADPAVRQDDTSDRVVVHVKEDKQLTAFSPFGAPSDAEYNTLSRINSEFTQDSYRIYKTYRMVNSIGAIQAISDAFDRAVPTIRKYHPNAPKSLDRTILTIMKPVNVDANQQPVSETDRRNLQWNLEWIEAWEKDNVGKRLDMLKEEYRNIFSTFTMPPQPVQGASPMDYVKVLDSWMKQQLRDNPEALFVNTRRPLGTDELEHLHPSIKEYNKLNHYFSIKATLIDKIGSYLKVYNQKEHRFAEAGVQDPDTAEISDAIAEPMKLQLATEIIEAMAELKEHEDEPEPSLEFAIEAEREALMGKPESSGT